jgi:integrase
MNYLPESDLAKVFRSAYEAETEKSHLHHMAMLVMYFTGTRVSQMLNLKGEDIFQRDGKWVVRVGAAKRGKVVVRNLHISDDPTVDMTPMIALAATKGLSKLFGGLSRQYYNDVLEKYFVAAGIHSSYAHSHVFRHSAAMTIYKATQRIGAVSEFLGHKSPSSAFVYLQENDGMFAQDAMDNLVLA